MKLKLYREQNDLSVITIANDLTISRQHVYDIENEEAYPSRKLAERIEQYTGGKVTAQELLFPKNKGQNQKATGKRHERNFGQ